MLTPTIQCNCVYLCFHLFQVKDEDRALTLGSLSIPMSRLLSSAELSMDQWFQLEKSGPASRMYITFMLRVGFFFFFMIKNFEDT